MMELLYEPDSQKRAFVDACNWAEDIYLCLAWIEPGDIHGPSFSDLQPHQHKVRQAIVGLSRLQSYPALLRRLHRSSVLRLVSTLDGSFSPNCYLFKSGTSVRVLVASAPFTSTRFGAPCEAFVIYEGSRDDPFVLRAHQLLERCRSSAHVPTNAELDAYEEAWASTRSGGRAVEAIPGLPLDTFDVSGLTTELSHVANSQAVLDAFVEVRDTIARSADMRVPGIVVARDEVSTEGTTTIYWSFLGMWSAFHRAENRYRFHMGFVQPWEVERSIASITLDGQRSPPPINALAAASTSDTMLLARSADGRRFLTHPTTNGEVEVRDDSGSLRASVIGEVGAADFVQTAAAFARQTCARRGRREELT